MQAASALASLADASASAGGAKKNDARELNDRFLRLLVAQMKNQDPLNPLDNAQVTTQMAQISTVTGIGNLTETVSRMLEQFNGLQTLQAAQLAGRDVLVAGNRMQLGDGGKARGAVELTAEAAAVKVEIRDASGQLVRTLDLGPKPAGTALFDWDGRNDAGKAVVAGRYTFTARAMVGNAEIAAGTQMAARVDGVRSEGGQVLLVLNGVGAVAYTEVKQIL
jgi:flagellar basal-body rod modification protein FlgD